MPHAYIPYARQSIDKKDIQATSSVLSSDWLTQGPTVLKFEQAIAKYCRSKYAVSTSSGTSALHLAYLASGIKKGDEVITTPNTFVATTNMLLVIGAKPVFCDIRLDTYNIDESKIEKLITKKTVAISVVHFAGNPAEMDKIIKIAKKYKLKVIEDASHALGASYRKKRIGSLESEATIFSFHPVKSIATGEGGIIVTNNKKYYEKMLLLRNHGIYKDKKGANVMTELGYNYRMTDIQASLGISQLKKLTKFIKKREQIVDWYKQELKDCDTIVLPTENKDSKSANHIYVIRIKNRNRRDKFVSFLKKNNIGVNFHYPSVYSHPYYRKNGYRKTKLSNEEKYNKTCITLPLFVGLQKKDIHYISSTIKSFF
jgi:UDP-4-amino-4,6-dideoxy-N-acetyl-beta-L-altrosamine transaminase